jgi:two-component system, cell cycle sensor histidine kinase and response regulator CckA
MSAAEWLIRVSWTLTDGVLRSKARLLAISLLSMTGVFLCVDVALYLSVPGYRPPWYGYVCLLGTYWLNRSGHYKVASSLVIAMFPSVVFAQVITGTSGDATMSLGFLTVSPLLGAILLSKSGVVLLSLTNIAGISLLPLVAPGINMNQCVGPLAATALGGALAVLYMHHRDQLERERRGKLQASEERLTIALEAAKLGSWDWHVPERQTLASRRLEAIFGLGPGEFGTDPRGYLPRVHPEDEEEVRARVYGFLKSKDAAIQYTHRILTPSGETRWIEINGTAQRDPGGNVLRMTGTVLDVSERRSLEAQLRQAQKMEAVGRLAGGIAHDFNNLLTIISGNVELVKGHQQQPELVEVLSAVQSAAHLTKQLLAFSRQAVLRPDVLNLNEVLRETSRMLRRIIGEDVQIEVDMAPGLHNIRVDAVQVQEILLNLATNARDAMPAGGTLTFRTANVRVSTAGLRGQPPQPGDYVLLSVSDTGEGMDSETQSRVFEPFFTTKEVGKGTGLGMAMVFGIVTQSGGSIHVESLESAGSTFRLYFPRSHEAITRAIRVTQPSEPGSETVLLVEDEEAVRQLSKMLLEQAGYRVLLADSADAAMRIAERPGIHIDVVLTDVVMPRGSGQTLVVNLRKQRPGLPALLMSGYPDLDRAHELTDFEFIQKPFARDQLLAQLRKALRTRSAAERIA